MEQSRDDVLKTIAAGGLWSPPSAVYAALYASLSTKLQSINSDESTATEKKEETVKIKQSLAALKLRNPPLDPLAQTKSVDKTGNEKEETAKDTLDSLIMILRYEYIQAVQENGKSSPRAKSIAEALKAAQDQRSGMVYIRPAMAYLRTSFPATSLQGDPNIPWDNMLRNHGGRNIPFIHGDDRGRSQDARLNTEIDKQFWQNINRVRVAGGGDTNYVLVNDDIGNWYIKGYSADPKDIINSAKNLTTFGMGGGVTSDFLAPKVAGDDAESKKKADPAIQKLLNKYKTDFDKRTNDDLAKVTAMTETKNKNNEIVKSIKSQWEADENIKPLTKDLVSVLDDAHKSFADAASEVADDDAILDKGLRIPLVLQSVRRFHNDIVEKIRIKTASQTKSLQEKIRESEEADVKAKSELVKAQSKFAEKEQETKRAAATVAVMEINRKNAEVAREAAEELVEQLPDSPNIETLKHTALTAKAQFESDKKDEDEAIIKRNELEVELDKLKNDVVANQGIANETQKSLEKAQSSIKQTNAGISSSIEIVTHVIREKIMDVVIGRKNAIELYETNLANIGAALKQE